MAGRSWLENNGLCYHLLIHGRERQQGNLLDSAAKFRIFVPLQQRCIQVVFIRYKVQIQLKLIRSFSKII